MDELIHLVSEVIARKADLKTFLKAAPRDATPHELVDAKSLLEAHLWDLWETGEKEPQARGYAFERITTMLAFIEGMNPVPPYKYRGAQVDGMIEVDGRYVLLELKWEKEANPIAMADISALQTKVDGKLVGTYGAFISMSGFSEDAPFELVKGKTINVVLVDDEDVFQAFSNAGSLTSVLRQKFRRAAQTGAVYFRFARWKDEEER